MCGVALALDIDPVGRRAELLEVLGGQLDIDRAGVLLQAMGLVVPGMGTIHERWTSSQASATCAAVAPLRAAITDSRSTSAWLAARACSVNRGRMLRRSESPKDVVLSIAPVRKP